MNRVQRKSRYINIKNSWNQELKQDPIIKLTTMFGTGNPKIPFNMIIMDFKKRGEIVKYGVMKI